MFYYLCGVYAFGLFFTSFQLIDQGNKTTGIVVLAIAMYLAVFDLYEIIKPDIKQDKPLQETDYKEKVEKFGNILAHIIIGVASIYIFYYSINAYSKLTQQKTESENDCVSQEEKLQQLVDSGKADIIIDGQPAGDGFDLDGIRLKNYEIKFKNGKVYMISYLERNGIYAR